MSSVKKYTFSIFRTTPMTLVAEPLVIEVESRTLSIAQAELRHHLRTHHADLLDDVQHWAYRLEVSHG